MNAISLNNSDELELGEIPSTVPEPKPARPNTPLARLFFDPTKPASILTTQNDHDVTPESERHHTQSSHSTPDSEDGKGKNRSRSRDNRKNRVVIDDDDEETRMKKNRRLPKKKKQAGGSARQENVFNGSEGSDSATPAEPLNSVPHQQALVTIQKAPIKQAKDAILEVKQCFEALHPERVQQKNGSVKLNNTNFDRFFKTRICPQFQAGFCERNLRCTFAHGEKQLRDVPNSNSNSRSATYKTKTCNNFDRGVCPKKKQDCNYAHGKEDLRISKHEDQVQRNQPRSMKIQTQNAPRGIMNGQKNDRRNEERQSASTGRQAKNDQEQSRRQHNSKNHSKPEKDINEKYTLTEKQHNFPNNNEKFPSHQNIRNYEHHQQGNYASTSDSGQMGASGFHNKNMMGNNFFGGYYPPGMSFVPSQSQMGFSSPPPLPEGYQNYYVPIYPCYSPLQHQMNFYPSYANFSAQASNSTAFNSPRTSYEYLNACNPNAGSPDGAFNAARGDKRQNGRHRPSRGQQQPTERH